MALDTTNMGLRAWNLGSDNFDFNSLSNDWGLIDVHDHSAGKGVQIPTGGIANLAVTGPKIAAGAVDSTKLAAAAVNDAALASPMFGVWRVIHQAEISLNAVAAGTYFFSVNGTPVTSGVARASSVPLFPMIVSDYTVANKTANWRMVVAYAVTGALPANTITASINPVTFSGASGQFIYTAGAAVPGSANLSLGAAPSAGSILTGAGQTIPAGNNLYGLVLTVTGAMAAGSQLDATAYIQVRHV